MSQENVELVQRLFAAVARFDADGVIADATRDGVIDASWRILGGGTYHGQQGIRDYFAMLAEAWSEVRTEPEEFIDVGDSVVVPVRVVNTGRSSGLSVGARAAWVAQLREGKVARMTVYQSRAEALEAVGLSE
jgi:ketosteroid isomerase-like protein